ncbi:phosphatase PAP2 family protein [Pseudoxanthomonas gei]|nr:phosphatase PAP2 family protein [Pseudoxanthomonas gei]
MPVAAWVALTAVLMGLHWDFWLADRVYAMEGHAWTLQSGYLTQDLIHAAGRQASKDAWFVLLLIAIGSALVPAGRQWFRPLTYLLVATLLSTAVVGALKRWTNMDCPWDLLRYGGHHLYYGLFTARPAALGHGQCFPAGHAGAGYAWIALYFFFAATRPRWRGWGLGLGLAVGLVFGIAQQLRGAHFLSHDLWSLMTCWLVALALYRLMLWNRPAPAILRSRP